MLSLLDINKVYPLQCLPQTALNWELQNAYALEVTCPLHLEWMILGCASLNQTHTLEMEMCCLVLIL